MQWSKNNMYVQTIYIQIFNMIYNDFTIQGGAFYVSLL